ncbi:hypothetical protein EVAR_77009_1 [Eumeta japonica]|uniref:Uncharacterized protein n=1 Tax=Eumeta variegata TaxID=151549 RepID=A0A4C1SF52_EUMVA|nr:hypothetical protein EVAR_77009_1 [Eumeta japonica]
MNNYFSVVREKIIEQNRRDSHESSPRQQPSNFSKRLSPVGRDVIILPQLRQIVHEAYGSLLDARSHLTESPSCRFGFISGPRSNEHTFAVDKPA